MELFEKIYKKSSLLRLQEARALNTIDEIYKALKKDDSGRRYIESLLNGKKNLPEWFRNLADNNNLDLIKQPLETLINRFNKLEKKDKNGNLIKIPDDFINSAICLLFKKSDSLDTMKSILANSMDTLIEYIKNANTKWIKELKSYNDVMTQKYNPDLWRDFENEIRNFKNKRDVNKGKEVSDEAKATLYDTLYEDDNWGLYVPKSFDGDKELASHIKAFKSYGETLHKAQWCTAAQAQYFDHYSYNGKKPLYVIKYFENGVYTEAWQIAFMDIDKHIEITDKRNEGKIDFLLKNAPIELFNKIIDTSNETKSYILPSLVKMYNNSTDGFNLDSGYSIFLELPNLSDDVKGFIGKEISLEELIKLRYFLASDSLEIVIKGLVNLKDKGYSLEYLGAVCSALGSVGLKDLEGYLELIKGNFSLDELKELKEFRESMEIYRLGYNDIEVFIRLKEKKYSLKYIKEAKWVLGLYDLEELEICINIIEGNFTLEELEEFSESIGHSSLTSFDLKRLIPLKEKGYSLEYLGAVCSALGSGGFRYLEEDLELIKGKFSLEELKELKEFRESISFNLLSYNSLKILIRIKEKGYSLKYASIVFLDLNLYNLGELEKCLDIIKDDFNNLEELKELKNSIVCSYIDSYGLEILIKLKEKGYSLKYLIYVCSSLGLRSLKDIEKCLDIIKGNFTLEELKEFRKSIGHDSLSYDDLEALTRLKEKDYSLKYLGEEYLSKVGSALGLIYIDELEDCIDIIKENFSLEELKEFRKSIGNIELDYITLGYLIRLKEKGYSLKYISDVFLKYSLDDIGELEYYLGR